MLGAGSPMLRVSWPERRAGSPAGPEPPVVVVGPPAGEPSPAGLAAPVAGLAAPVAEPAPAGLEPPLAEPAPAWPTVPGVASPACAIGWSDAPAIAPSVTMSGIDWRSPAMR